MKKIFLFIILLIFMCPLSFAQTRNFKLVKTPTENPTNQKRKAVVIGMSDYGAGRSLNNTLNDATDMADALTTLGFEVTLLKNNDLRNLNTNLTNWYNSIEGNDMAIFYFAGHGMEVNGENYLVPVDAELNSQTDVQYNALNVNQVLGNMDEKRVSMKLLILDACRDNPFKRSWSRGSEEKGLAGMSAPKGTFIAFAASPGATAQDGGTYNLQNGVFTYYLKQEILKEGVSIDNIFTNVSDDVSNLTHDQQIPFRNTSLTKRFYFIPQGNDEPVPSPASVVDVAEIKKQLPQPANDEISFYFAGYQPEKVIDGEIPITVFFDGTFIGSGTIKNGFSITIKNAKPGKHNIKFEVKNHSLSGVAGAMMSSFIGKGTSETLGDKQFKINTSLQTSFEFECKTWKSGKNNMYSIVLK